MRTLRLLPHSGVPHEKVLSTPKSTAPYHNAVRPLGLVAFPQESPRHAIRGPGLGLARSEFDLPFECDLYIAKTPDKLRWLAGDNLPYSAENLLDRRQPP